MSYIECRDGGAVTADLGLQGHASAACMELVLSRHNRREMSSTTDTQSDKHRRQ